jgi:hypothetical protein
MPGAARAGWPSAKAGNAALSPDASHRSADSPHMRSDPSDHWAWRTTARPVLNNVIAEIPPLNIRSKPGRPASAMHA